MGSELKIDLDPDNKVINMNNTQTNTGINLKEDNSNAMLGVELLANPKSNKAELSVASDISGGYSSGYSRGYSSGEDTEKTNKTNMKIMIFFNRMKAMK